MEPKDTRSPVAADPASSARGQLDLLYRSESRRILATLIRLLGDFDRAEEALHDAFAAAVEQWPREGIPSNPRAWLVSTGRFRAIDRLRKESRLDNAGDLIEDQRDPEPYDPADAIDDVVGDDQLRLIFTCCHPALSADARISLTLREVCGLTTESIASAFLSTPPTIAQRIVRAKAKIRDARIPYQIPSASDLPERLETVLKVIYLVFNEGYSPSSGDTLTQPALSAEAIRLGRLLVDLLPDAEALGLLGLMLIQESRRRARSTPSGDLVLLENQDRSLWNQDYIAEGSSLVARALGTRQFGSYALQAAIAAVHAGAATTALTDWHEIVGLYDILLTLEPSPVVALNRAVAVAMRDGPAAGLPIVEALLAQGELNGYHFVHSVRGELLHRLGRDVEARDSFLQAFNLAQQGAVRRFLERRISELAPKTDLREQ